MLTPTSLDEQLRAADQDPLRVLVAGAGVAGRTVAQLLRRGGLHPVLVERSGEDAGAGYMLALMAMADPVIGELGVRERYLAASVGLGRYGIRSHTGRPLRIDRLNEVLGRFGDYRGISRSGLLEVLSGDGGALTRDTRITGIHESGGGVEVALRSGADRVDAEFDLVIAADGLHSTTRDLLPGGAEEVDTGWGGWVAWVAPDADLDLGEELWGAGFFVGSYPVLDRIGVFVGGPRAATGVGPARFAANVRRRLQTCDGRLDRILDAVARAETPYYWPLTDVRARNWVSGRTVLLGDAAAGFLPTAGIGAGMAMESAWVLATALRSATAAELPALLRTYVAAQRPRVEAAQDTSRRLARLMFRRGRTFAAVRDLAMSAVSIDVALGPIRKLLETRPSPGFRPAPRRRR